MDFKSKYPIFSEEGYRIKMGANRDIKYPSDLEHCDDESKKHSRYNIPIIKNCFVSKSSLSGSCPPAFYKENDGNYKMQDYRIELSEGKTIWDEIN